MPQLWNWWTIRQLKSSTPARRIRAARQLAHAGSGSAVPALIQALADEDPGVQTAAAEALARIPHPAAIEPLVALLARRAGQAVAAAAAAQGEQAVKPLLHLLTAEDRGARRWCAHALGLIGDARAVDALARALQDKRSEVRQEAAMALGRIGGAPALEPLTAALASRDADTRRAAVEALGAGGGEAAIDALAKAAGDADETVQLSAVRALAKAGGMRAALAMRPALESGRKTAREAAQGALRSMELAPPEAEERASLAVLMGDYTAAAVEGEAAIRPLTQALESVNPRSRAAASGALGELRSAKSVRPLLRALEDREPEVRQAARRSLESLLRGAAGHFEDDHLRALSSLEDAPDHGTLRALAQEELLRR